MSGPYGRLRYLESLCGPDERVLPLWGGGVLIRPVPGTELVDAATAYPMGGFSPAADIDTGMAALRDAGAITLTAIVDPLNAIDPEVLRPFETVRRRLKTHYVIDFEAGPFAPTKHHRYEVARVSLHAWMSRWNELYAALGDRHGIGAASRLGGRHFEALADDPQAVVLAAEVGGTVEAMSIWLSDGEVAHNHLGASSPAGYAASCSYAQYAAAIEGFEDHRCLDLGGMPGLEDDPEHGLARFKRGFANAERATWLSGFVLDTVSYQQACATTGIDTDGGAARSSFFPAYRAPS